MGEIVFLAIVFLVSGAMFVMSYDFRVSIIDQSGGPALFPRIVIILLIFAGLIRVVQILIKKEAGKKFAFLEMFQGIRLVYILVTLAYMIVITQLGYILSTIAYLIVSILLYYRREVKGDHNPRRLILIALVNSILVIAVYFFFTRVANILLPEGILGG